MSPLAARSEPGYFCKGACEQILGTPWHLRHRVDCFCGADESLGSHLGIRLEMAERRTRFDPRFVIAEEFAEAQHSACGGQTLGPTFEGNLIATELGERSAVALDCVLFHKSATAS